MNIHVVRKKDPDALRAILLMCRSDIRVGVDDERELAKHLCFTYSERFKVWLGRSVTSSEWLALARECYDEALDVMSGCRSALP